MSPRRRAVPLLLGEEPEPDEDEELGELELGVEELPEDELELGDFDGVDALPDEDDELGELPLIEPELLLELRFDGSAEDEPAEDDESPARSQPYRPPTAMARGNRMNADFLSIGSSSEGWWEAP